MGPSFIGLASSLNNCGVSHIGTRSNHAAPFGKFEECPPPMATQLTALIVVGLCFGSIAAALGILAN